MNISILGCGWLGFPLALKLIEKGHTIKGSTTTEQKLSSLEEYGIQPYQLNFNPDLEGDDEGFWDSEVLILNIPPGRRRKNVKEFHSQQIENIVERVKDSSIEFLLFISSTSVFPKRGGVMREEDAIPGKATRNSGEALLKAEQMVMNENTFATTVVRLGGLYGYDRHPANYLTGKEDIPHGNAPVNLIHQDDCVNILTTIIEQNVREEIFNAVSDGHPPKNQFYKTIAKQAGLEPPSFLPDDEKDYKVISNRKLKKALDYQFMYPNPMNISLAFS